MIYFNIIVSVILVIWNIVKKRSKIGFYILLIWMWILFSFNTNSADFEMYKGYYELGRVYSSYYDGIEILYKISNDLGNLLNLNFIQFKMIYSGIALILLNIAIKRLTTNFSFALGCYFIFPYLIDIVQIRHFMASIIILLAITVLKDRDKKSYIKYYILNMIAIGFHNISIVFLIIPLLNYISVKKLSIIVILADIIEIILIIFGGLKLIAKNFLTEEKYQAYFVSDRWQNGFSVMMFYAIIQLICTILFLIISKKFGDKIQEKENDKTNDIKKYRYELTLKLNIFNMLIFPYYYYLMELTRIFRMILPLNWCITSNSLSLKSTYNNLYLKIFTIFICIILFTFLVLRMGILDKTVNSIMKYNSFMQFLF